MSRRFIVYRALGVMVSLLAAAACVIVYGRMAMTSSAGILHDQRVWNEGSPELPAQVRGEVTTRQFLLKSYRLDVTFRDPEGNVQERKLEFDTLFGGMPEESEMSVRLSRNNPADFALNAAVEVSSKRWAATAFLGGVGILLLGGAFGALAFAAGRQWRRVAHAARNGAPVSCALLNREAILNQGRPTGAEKFTFRVPASAVNGPGFNGTDVDVSYQLRTKKSDVISVADGRVLAIVPPDAPAQAILLLRDYYPFALGDSERLQADASVGKAS